jgi:hypothetical protein
MCWVELGHFGIDPEVVPLLNGWRLRGNTKGLAVRITCPKKGALSDLEFAGFQQRLLKAFETGDITLDHFVLVTLFMATGRRPCQLADIKALDFIETRSCDGLSEFVLKVPRRKQRGGRWRAEFKAIALTPEIGMAVRELIVENEATFLALWPGLPGRAEPDKCMPGFTEIGSVDSTTVLRMASFHIGHQRDLAQCHQLGIKGGTIMRCNSCSCDPCIGLDDKTDRSDKLGTRIAAHQRPPQARGYPQPTRPRP